MVFFIIFAIIGTVLTVTEQFFYQGMVAYAIALLGDIEELRLIVAILVAVAMGLLLKSFWGGIIDKYPDRLAEISVLSMLAQFIYMLVLMFRGHATIK